MIKIEYELREDESSIVPLREKTFTSEQEYYRWLRSQDDHPFLYIEVIKEIRN